MGARKDIFQYISEYGLRTYSSQELREIGKTSSWARVVRQMRQDGVIEYDNNKSDNSYTITAINKFKSTGKRSGLSAKQKYRIRHRDGHRCQACGKGVNDGIKLHVDHKIPVEMGGTNLDNNLWTLCDYCNQGKKDFFKDDFDPEVMKSVFREKSGYQKLKRLFELSPYKEFTPSVLQGISGIRDWTRSIRLIRERENINIQWFAPTDEFANGYYSNVP